MCRVVYVFQIEGNMKSNRSPNSVKKYWSLIGVEVVTFEEFRPNGFSMGLSTFQSFPWFMALGGHITPPGVQP